MIQTRMNTLQYEMKKLIFLIMLGLPSVVFGKSTPLFNEGPNSGWNIFGQCVLDSFVDATSKEIIIDIDWDLATWGAGAMITLTQPIDGKLLQSIKMDVTTLKGSDPRITAGIATHDDANLIYHYSEAPQITGEFLTYEFAIDRMVKDMPNETSKIFSEGDWSKIQAIKLIFLKPKSKVPNADRIVIRRPELISNNSLETDTVSTITPPIDQPRPSSQKDSSIAKNSKTTRIVKINQEKTVKTKRMDKIPQSSKVNKDIVSNVQATSKILRNTSAVKTIRSRTIKGAMNSKISPFGTGILNWGNMGEENQIFLDVGWDQSGWGVGLVFDLDQPINIHDPWIFRARTKTLDGSKPRVSISVLANANEIYSSSAEDRVKLKKKWTNISFPLSSMVIDPTNASKIPSPEKTLVDQIKIVYTKPGSDKVNHDIILLFDPELTLKSVPQTSKSSKTSQSILN